MKKRFFTGVVLAVACVMALSAVNAVLCGEKGREAGTSFGGYHQYSGVIHVHTTYSDGSGGYDDIARAASSLDLHFVIPSDHNTVRPHREEGVRYIGRTLVMPSVEISTDGSHGHFLVIGDSVPLLPRGGVSSDSVFSGAVLAGDMTVLAHICHSRRRLDWDRWDICGGVRSVDADTVFHAAMLGNAAFRAAASKFVATDDWDDWNIGPFTGIELFNLDANWRACLAPERINRLFGALLVSPFRDDAMNYVLTPPVDELRKFDEVNMKRKVMGIGSVDAHSRLELIKDRILRFPSYVAMFRTVQTVIVTREPFTGNSAHDADLVFDALRNGRAFVGFGGVEETRGFMFTAQSGGADAIMGESLPLERPAELRIDIPDSNGVVCQLLRNGEVIDEWVGRAGVRRTVREPGVYRVQVFQERRLLPFFLKRRLPWILSNPIYLYPGEYGGHDYKPASPAS